MTDSTIAFVAGAWAAIGFGALTLGIANRLCRSEEQQAEDDDRCRPGVTKADRIRELLKDKSDAQIARRLSCDQGYVRAVRQRTSETGQPIARAYDWSWAKRKAARAREEAAQ